MTECRKHGILAQTCARYFRSIWAISLQNALRHVLDCRMVACFAWISLWATPSEACLSQSSGRGVVDIGLTSNGDLTNHDGKIFLEDVVEVVIEISNSLKVGLVCHPVIRLRYVLCYAREVCLIRSATPFTKYDCKLGETWISL